LVDRHVKYPGVYFVWHYTGQAIFPVETSNGSYVIFAKVAGVSNGLMEITVEDKKD
jgi:hypothetical protein